ncbi:MAG: hypothetical protein KAR30_00270 [Gammaproteobacteria bacterium]|nr:hypothetical protein [Gammaproteobacteria bacterium]
MNSPGFSSLRACLILLVLVGTIPALLLVVYSGFELCRYAADEVRHNAGRLVSLAADEQQPLVRDACSGVQCGVFMPPWELEGL